MSVLPRLRVGIGQLSGLLGMFARFSMVPCVCVCVCVDGVCLVITYQIKHFSWLVGIRSIALDFFSFPTPTVLGLVHHLSRVSENEGSLAPYIYLKKRNSQKFVVVDSTFFKLKKGQKWVFIVFKCTHLGHSILFIFQNFSFLPPPEKSLFCDVLLC